MKNILYFLFVLGLVSSCKTNDSFSAHHRRYKPGYYFENSGNANNPKTVRAKKQAEKTNIPVRNLKVDNELTASNTGIVSPSLDVKQPAKKTKSTFNQLLNHHSPQEISQKVRNLVKTENKRLSQRKANRVNKQPGGNAVSGLVAYILFYVALAFIVLGAGLVYAGIGTNPISVVGGVLLVILGLAVLATAAMLGARGGY